MFSANNYYARDSMISALLVRLLIHIKSHFKMTSNPEDVAPQFNMKPHNASVCISFWETGP